MLPAVSAWNWRSFVGFKNVGPWSEAENEEGSRIHKSCAFIQTFKLSTVSLRLKPCKLLVRSFLGEICFKTLNRFTKIQAELSDFLEWVLFHNLIRESEKSGWRNHYFSSFPPSPHLYSPVGLWKIFPFTEGLIVYSLYCALHVCSVTPRKNWRTR